MVDPATAFFGRLNFSPVPHSPPHENRLAVQEETQAGVGEPRTSPGMNPASAHPGSAL